MNEQTLSVRPTISSKKEEIGTELRYSRFARYLSSLNGKKISHLACTPCTKVQESNCSTLFQVRTKAWIHARL